MADFLGYLRTVEITEGERPQTLGAPFVSPLATVFEPTSVDVVQRVDAPTWTASTTVFTPEVSELGLSVPPWSVSTTVYAPSSIRGVQTLNAPPWSASTSVFAPVVAGPLTAPAWSVSTTLYSPSSIILAGPLIAPAWTVSTEVFTPTVAGALIASAWTVSTEVFTAFVGFQLEPGPWPVSTTVPTPALIGPQTVTAPYVAPTTTVYTPAVQDAISVPPWSVSTDVFAPVIAGPLTVGVWPLSTEVYEPVRIVAAEGVSINGSSAFTRGDRTLSIFGSVLDMSTCSDLASFTDVSTGSGTAALGRLAPGGTAGSVAALRDTRDVGDVDVEVTSRVTARAAFELVLRVDAATEFRMRVENNEVRATVTLGGTTSFDYLVARGVRGLRLVRHGSQVRVLAGGQVVLTAAWTAALARIELRALGAQQRATVLDYTRRPVIAFGGVPALDVTQLQPTFVTCSPPARNLPGTVDVSITGCDTTATTLSGAFTYVAPTDAQRVTPQGAATLTVYNV